MHFIGSILASVSEQLDLLETKLQKKTKEVADNLPDT